MLHRLTTGEIIALASPSLVAALGIREPKDLRRATLLIHRSRPDAWSEWFAAHWLDGIGAQPSLAFGQFTMVLQAAIAGLGVAIAPSFLARPELAAGELIGLFEPIVQTGQGDFFAYPVEKKDFAPIVAFRDWILEEAAVQEPGAREGALRRRRAKSR